MTWSDTVHCYCLSHSLCGTCDSVSYAAFIATPLIMLSLPTDFVTSVFNLLNTSDERWVMGSKQSKQVGEKERERKKDGRIVTQIIIMYKQCTDFLCQQLKHPPPTPNLQYHCLHLFCHFSCIPIVPSFYRPLLHQLISPPPPRAVLSLTCFSLNAVPYVIKMYILFHVLEFDPITANRSIDVCVFMRDFFCCCF